MSTDEKDLAISVTRLLESVKAGEDGALDRLFQHVYPELKRLAGSVISRRAKGPNTPSATTLVHHACVRLLLRDAMDVDSKRRFFGLFCRAMEDEWVERARHDLAKKRKPIGTREELTDFAAEIRMPTMEFDDLRQALSELAKHDSEAAELVSLRFYCAASLQEAAEITGTSLSTVRRNWNYAKAWLHERLTRDKG